MDSETEPTESPEEVDTRRRQTFHSKLADFPHTFQLEDEHRNMQAVHLLKLKKCLQTALSVGYETALERARAKNYLAFLLGLRGEWSGALAMTQEALEEESEQHNLVSLANKAVILWNMGRNPDAQKQLQLLEELKADHADFDYLKVKAKAELAFACTRMGPSFFIRAITLFEEVLLKARAPEKWLWTFGLALTRRRSLHLLISPMFHRQHASIENTNTMTLDAFMDVTHYSNSTNLKAKAHAEIAVLLGFMVWDAKEKERLVQRAGAGPLDNCRIAHELDANDNSVLCKVGRFLRKAKFFNDSKDLLGRALKIRPSSTAFQHLGLTYKVLAKIKKRVENGEKTLYERTESWLDRGRGRGPRGRLDYTGRNNSRRQEGEQIHSGGYYGEASHSRGYGGRGGNRGRPSRGVYGGRGERNQPWQREARYQRDRGLETAGAGNQGAGVRHQQAGRSGAAGNAEEQGHGAGWGYCYQGVNTSPQDRHDMDTQFQRMTLEQADTQAHETQSGDQQYQSHGETQMNRSSALCDLDSGVFKLAKAIKSPPHRYNVQLSKTDPLVSMAMQCFEEAFKFSEGTNVQALYDVALMHRYVGDLDRALELLEEMREVNRERLNYLTVNAFEQAGMILTEKSEAEEDDQKKKQLAAEAESMFYRALEKAVLLYSRNPIMQGHISEVWHSFLKILKTIDDCPDLNVTEKLMKKAEHFLKMSDTKQSKILLDQLQQLPAEGYEKRQTLKLCIELYRQTGEFEKALALLEILNSTPEGRATMADVLEDSPQYEQLLHLGAARKALHNNALAHSRDHFRAAFTRAFTQHPPEDSSSSDSDTSEGDPETWDVMVLYNRLKGQTAAQNEQKAKALTKVLRNACGLKVTVLDEDASLGRYDVLSRLVHVMRRSRLVLVLIGEGRLCPELRFLIDHAAKRQKSTTVILSTGGNHVPQVLNNCRSMTCPAELLTSTQEPASQTSCSEPASQTSCSEPASQTSCSEPTSQTSCSEPTSQTSCSEPASQTSCSEPTSQTSCSEPTSQTSCSEPTSQTSTQELASQTSCTEPTSQTSCKELASQTSCQETASETSCEELASQTSCQEPASQTSCVELASPATGAESAEHYSEETVRAICKVFKFLIGL